MNQSGYADLLNSSIIDADSLTVGTLILPNLDTNSVPYIDVNNNLADLVLGSGQLLIGQTGNPPIANTLTGTVNEVIISNAPGSITLSTPQPIATTSSPTFNNLTLSSNLIGPTYSRTADNVLSISTSQTTNNLLSFTSAPKVAQDSGIASSQVVINSSTGVSGNVPEFSSATSIIDSGVAANKIVVNTSTVTSGNIAEFNTATNISDSGIAANKVVINTSTGTSGNLPEFNSATNISDSGVAANKVVVNTATGVSGNLSKFNSATNISDSGIIAANVVTNTSTSVSGDVCSFSGTGGKLITDSGIVAANVVTNTSTSVSGDVCSFSGTGGKLITDSGIVAANVVTNTSTSVSGDVCSFSGTGGKLITDSGIVAANVVTNTGTSVSGDVCSFSGTGGKLITDSGIVASTLTGGPFLPLAGGVMTGDINFNSAHNITNLVDINGIVANNLVTGPSVVTSNNIATYLGTTGKVIQDGAIQVSNLVAINSTFTSGHVAQLQSSFGAPGAYVTDSGHAITEYMPLTGGIFLGSVGMGANNITGTSNTITAGVIDAIGTTDSTSSTTGALLSAGGCGITKRLNVGTQLAVGVNRSTALSAFEVVGTGGINVTNGGASSSVEQLTLNYDTTNDRSNIVSIHQGIAFTDVYFQCNNLCFNTVSNGSSAGTICIANASTTPSAAPTGGGVLYVTGGALWYRGSSNTNTKIASA